MGDKTGFYIQEYARTISVSKLPESYVSMDTETTGLDFNKDHIIEISALKVVEGKPIDKFSSLVMCEFPIPKQASEVNGITKKMLSGAPPIHEVMHYFAEFSSDMTLLGHNVNGFDRRFIERECLKISNVSFDNEWFDTLELARKMYTGHLKLSDLCEQFGIENQQSHRALSDCIATHECYQAMRLSLLQITTDANDFAPNQSFGGDKMLDGLFFVFTGERQNLSQHAAMQMAIDRGARLQNGVTLKTDYLVNLGGETTGKVKKAIEYQGRTGIKIIDASQFIDLCNKCGDGIDTVKVKVDKEKIKPVQVTHEEARDAKIESPTMLKQNQKVTPKNEKGCHSKDNGIGRKIIKIVEISLAVVLGFFALICFAATTVSSNTSSTITGLVVFGLIFAIGCLLLLVSALGKKRKKKQ